MNFGIILFINGNLLARSSRPDQLGHNPLCKKPIELLLLFVLLLFGFDVSLTQTPKASQKQNNNNTNNNNNSIGFLHRGLWPN